MIKITQRYNANYTCLLFLIYLNQHPPDYYSKSTNKNNPQKARSHQSNKFNSLESKASYRQRIMLTLHNMHGLSQGANVCSNFRERAIPITVCMKHITNYPVTKILMILTPFY